MSVINTNIMSLNTQRALGNSRSDMQTAMQRLSTGLRINSAKDDAAGLGIGKLMGAEIASFNQSIRNANDGISMVQTAEGALEEMQVMVQRVKELATQAANGTMSDEARENIQAELDQLSEEFTAISNRTTFNGNKLLDGSLKQGSDTPSAGDVVLQVGTNGGDATASPPVPGDIITVNFGNLTEDTGNGGTADGAVTKLQAKMAAGDDTTPSGVDSAATARTLMGAADDAMKAISTQRAQLGASQNRLDHAVSNLQVMSENLSAAKSQIMDADFAAETAALSRAQVLQQAGTAMLAQANQAPQNVLSLLR